jgi:dipeptidyl-peptidase-4
VRVTTAEGTHEFQVGPGARYAIDVWSRLGVPPRVTLFELPGMRAVRVLEDNADVTARLAALDARAPQRVRVPMPDGTQLDAYRIVPPGFDSSGARRYPVLLHAYGGPASPRVVDGWGGREQASASGARDYLWHQLLAQQGYVVLVVDPRGSAWRGRAFRKVTQLRLGEHEARDLVDTGRWLGARPWADASRLGMWGWSYGGYLTALALARGGPLFKAGIVVAPVSDWRYYDTIYAERYMRTPQTNAAGYRAASVLTHLETLRARLLLVHGTGDDNVHPQHTSVLVDALVAADKPFTSLLYPNRTHSISGGNTTRHLFGSFTRFVQENL